MMTLMKMVMIPTLMDTYYVPATPGSTLQVSVTFNPWNNPMRQVLLLSDFTDEETAQRDRS